jgi:ubiquinone/menaquinone biosynthesis C-methylase UbiE
MAMPTLSERFDANSVRAEWDAAADAYAEAQATGRDFYRLNFFGPAHVELCGAVKGRKLLDVGCGTGYFAREMASRGANVTGIDMSAGMLDHAQRLERQASLGIDYANLDAARLREHFGAASFDMVTSCLALQDMPDIPKVLRSIHDVLVPGGRLVASIAHPCSDTPYRNWQRDDRGAKRWLCIDRYFDRGPLEYAWKGWLYEFSTSAYHATLEDWFGWMLNGGFTLRAMREPMPSDAAVAMFPELDDARRVPYFLLFDVERKR